MPKVASPPEKPTLIFDGDCGFCRAWIRRWKQATGERVDYIVSQQIVADETFPEVPVEQYKKSVVLVEPDGTCTYGARAALHALSYGGGKYEWLYRGYNHVPLFAPAAEAFYYVVARNRMLFSRISLLLYGKHVMEPQHCVTRSIFLRALALVYLSAFISFWVQVQGLVGRRGILPIREHLESIGSGVGAIRFVAMPTLSWLNASDAFLHVQCGLGVLCGLLVLAGVGQAIALFLLWLLYLSVSTAGQDFMQFQWDILLTEAGFLAIWFAPLKLLPSRCVASEPSRLILFLLRFLCFKLMFQSGLVKLLSQDETWWNLTALKYHFETQPLPNWVAYYVQHLPMAFHKLQALVTFGIELLLPFLIFTFRRLRILACLAMIGLQLMIMLTGNYGFFNVLSIVLCIPLLDDFVWPTRLKERFAPLPEARKRRWHPAVIVPVFGILLFVNLALFTMRSGVRFDWPRPLREVAAWAGALRVVNNYGLFADMTEERPEITIEGSADGKEWKPYLFKYKPGQLDWRPGFVLLHMPRLDWQMWFAALSRVEQNPWFVNLLHRLLKNEASVANLLRQNPFAEKPPAFIRARIASYTYTTLAEKRATGNWWRSDVTRTYCPAVELDQAGEQLRIANLPPRI